MAHIYFVREESARMIWRQGACEMWWRVTLALDTVSQQYWDVFGSSSVLMIFLVHNPGLWGEEWSELTDNAREQLSILMSLVICSLLHITMFSHDQLDNNTNVNDTFICMYVSFSRHRFQADAFKLHECYHSLDQLASDLIWEVWDFRPWR